MTGSITPIPDRRRAQAELRERERRYRHIFETAGVSIWEQDFSRPKAAIDELKARGVRDFPDYLAQHPEFVREAISMVRVVDVNDATLRLFAAESKHELLESLHQVFVPETHEVFAGELIAIAEGRTFFEGEATLRTLKGEPLTALFTMTFPPPPDRLTSVLVTVIDITERKRVEQTLRETEEQWRAAFECNPTMYFMVDANGTIVSVNPFGAEQLGYGVEELVGQPVLNVFVEADREFVQRNAAACLERMGETIRWEARKVRKDGTMLWVRETANAVVLKDRPVLLVVCEDISDGKRAEALLAGEKRILEMVAKGDSLAQILESLCRLVEAQAQGVLASVLLVQSGRLVHGGAPSLPKAYVDAIDRAAIGPSVGSCGTAAYRGEQVLVSDIATDPLWADYREAALSHSLRACWSTPIFSSEGNVIATFAMYYREPRRPDARDQEIIEQITNLAGIAIQRKLGEEKLRRSETYLSEAQRISHTGSWAWSPVTGIAYWSEECYRVLDFDPTRGLPSFESFAERIHPEDRPAFMERLQKSVLAKADFEAEYRIVVPGGAVRNIHALAHPVLSPSGDLVESVGLVMDITERTRAEAERAKLEERLRQAEKMEAIGRFASGIAHDFNNVIGGILAYGEMLFDEAPENAPRKRYAQNVLTAATRGRELVEQILAYSRSERGKRTPTDVCRTVAETLELVRSSLPARIALHATIPEVPLVVLVDTTQLHQIVMNLCSNSIYAMKAGGPLRVTLTPRDIAANRVLSHGSLSAGRYVCVSVEDSGCGMDEATLARIFEPFFTTKEAGRGTGLGLALVYAIVIDLGGAIDVKSVPDEGSTFSIYLPLLR